MSSGTFVDRIDPFAKRSLKKKSKKSQGSSRYRNSQDVELQQLPQLKGEFWNYNTSIVYVSWYTFEIWFACLKYYGRKEECKPVLFWKSVVNWLKNDNISKIANATTTFSSNIYNLTLIILNATLRISLNTEFQYQVWS